MTSPILLIVVLLAFGVSYWIFSRSQEKQLKIFGKELTLVQQYCLIGLCSMPLFYIAGAGAALFWVMGVSCFLILLHATFYDIDAILDAQEDSFELTMEQVV